MGCVDEIIKRLAIGGEWDETRLRIVLNDYDITKRTTELVIAGSSEWQKAVQMFLVTKKVEGCTEKTIRYYKGTLRKFFHEIGMELKEIDADQVKYYLAIRASRDKLSKTSQDNELRVLKSFFKWCMNDEYIIKDPTANIKAVKKEKRIKKTFTETELELIRKNTKTIRDRAIVEVLYSTGVRVSELCGINRQDINGDEILVFGKGEKERVVFLNARAKLALKEYLESRTDENEALFVAERAPHERLEAGGVEVMIRETGERAGIHKCHPHRFRRTAATIALNRGMPIEQVQKMLGHEDIGTTTIYARSEEENVKANHRKYVV
ncbi:MAG: tyrosine-type recombinase/integrase [Roseburia sp.]|nr:tyrosine-type recombinase/integrase [Roseburia sp.]MCM1097803.1 tyrosine-type recombinase/integrase [Ruminococcus flavefaciens]